MTSPLPAFAAIVVAAGSGSRAGGTKQWRDLGGQPVVRWSVAALLEAGAEDVVVVVAPGAEAEANAALLGLSQCKKKDPGPPPTPESLLPPATQTGANTFGCLLNGQPWTPSGFDGRSNYSVSYDPTYNGGTLSITAYRYFGQAPKSRQDMVLGAINLNNAGTYQLNLPNERVAGFRDWQTGCEFLQSENTYRRGTLTITRLDVQAGIISGTFDFTLYKSSCGDTIKVTQGRFDKKL